ncbi:MAG TPA: nucleotidyl transferase AbiEii/AbiGii toxin family protein [Methylomirabilota bacterium]|nr:nucleotidyl transferase AbiEii/AbiGii toxin family protein [Methylomirabilota bacterium]
MQYHPETIPQATQAVLSKIKQLPQLDDFYLSGGTALSLYLGHRESEDLDFFTARSFQPEFLQQKLLSYGNLTDVSLEEGTLNCFMDDVKLQFLYYPYSLLEQPKRWNEIKLSALIDIACTKLMTISMRGSKKDFIDIYVFLQQMPLEKLFEALAKKYQKTEYNYPHILKSLVYFADADEQPMPKMHNSLAWEAVKQFFMKEIKNFPLDK